MCSVQQLKPAEMIPAGQAEILILQPPWGVARGSHMHHCFYRNAPFFFQVKWSLYLCEVWISKAERKAALGSVLNPKASQQLVCSRASPLCPPSSDVCLLNPAARKVVIPCARGANVLVLVCPPEHTDIPSLSQSTSKFLTSRAAVETWVAARETQGCLLFPTLCWMQTK